MMRVGLPVLLSFLGGALFSPAGAQESEELRNAIVAEERAYLETERKKGSVSRNLDTILEKRRKAVTRLEEVRTGKAKLLSNIESLQAEQEVLRNEVATARQRAGGRLALLSRMSSAGPLEILLTARHPADFVYRYHAIRAVNEADRKLLAKVRVAEDKLAKVQLAMDAQLQEIEALESEAEAELLKVDALVMLQKEELAKLDDRLGERQLFIEKMKREATALGDLVNAASDGTVDAVAGRRRPLASAVLLAGYGQPDPALGGVIDISGWRLQAPRGATVSTVASGKVTFSGWFQGFGNLVVVDHGGGYTSLYAHLDERKVDEADELIAGEPVGAAGLTGSALQSGLYFELRRDGRPIDPISWDVTLPGSEDR